MRKFETLTEAKEYKVKNVVGTILMGDDGRFWVCSGSVAYSLIRQGYEVAI